MDIDEILGAHAARVFRLDRVAIAEVAAGLESDGRKSFENLLSRLCDERKSLALMRLDSRKTALELSEGRLQSEFETAATEVKRLEAISAELLQRAATRRSTVMVFPLLIMLAISVVFVRLNTFEPRWWSTAGSALVIIVVFFSSNVAVHFASNNTLIGRITAAVVIAGEAGLIVADSSTLETIPTKIGVGACGVLSAVAGALLGADGGGLLTEWARLLESRRTRRQLDRMRPKRDRLDVEVAVAVKALTALDEDIQRAEQFFSELGLGLTSIVQLINT
ncbi:MAG: hypothetical protein JWM34_1086 [Ilumatobacteraceae bacterium]|nr:hypothetical protein [Ilumatobacteraceae bacterium]